MNSAGFLSSVVALLAIGAVLTVVDPAATYGLAAFRVAELTQVPVWAVGLFMVVRSARALRRRADGPAGRAEDADAVAGSV